MVQIEDIVFRYPSGPFALSVASLHIAVGERVAIVGPSGSGKSSLLALITGILSPQQGRISVRGNLLSGRSDAWLRRFRLRNIGHMSQSLSLLPYLNVMQNIMLPALADRELRRRVVESDALALLTSVGLAGCADRYPHQLSQGERQRVVVCRALVVAPSLVVADEPTGNLDGKRAETVLDLMLERSSKLGAAFIMATHNRQLLTRFTRVLDVAGYAGGRT